MAVTSLLVLPINVSFDPAIGKYNALWISVDDENQSDFGDTVFDITASTPVVNAQIIQDAKDSHNAKYGSNFNAATPSALFGGKVL
jgi:hypothetical protein